MNRLQKMVDALSTLLLLALVAFISAGLLCALISMSATFSVSGPM